MMQLNDFALALPQKFAGKHKRLLQKRNAHGKIFAVKNRRFCAVTPQRLAVTIKKPCRAADERDTTVRRISQKSRQRFPV